MNRASVRPFIPLEKDRIVHIIGRALALSQEATEHQLGVLAAGFASRHIEVRAVWRRHFERVKGHVLPALHRHAFPASMRWNARRFPIHRS